MRLGRWMMTGVLVAQAVLGFYLDWSPNHLLNPLWHGHARFHGALLLFLLAGVSAMGVWLLWRKSKEPEVAVQVAAMISAAFWTPFFYVTFLLPGSTLWAGDPNRMIHVAGSVFYPNVAVAALFLALTGAAWRLCRTHPERRSIGRPFFGRTRPGARAPRPIGLPELTGFAASAPAGCPGTATGARRRRSGIRRCDAATRASGEHRLAWPIVDCHHEVATTFGRSSPGQQRNGFNRFRFNYRVYLRGPYLRREPSAFAIAPKQWRGDPDLDLATTRKDYLTSARNSSCQRKQFEPVLLMRQ